MAGNRSNRLKFSVSEENKESVAATIPHELVVEILTRLPAFHLWPLRCVSKTWRKLFTRDPSFAKLHFNRSVSSPSILANTSSGKTNIHLALDYTACNETINLGFPFQEDEDYYSLVGISNGLICILHMTPVKRDVYIWNPIIKDHISLKFQRSGAYFGFGFHQDINAYKTVKIYPYTHLYVSVWTLGVDSSWRYLQEYNEHITSIMDTPTPIVNGCVHWIVVEGFRETIVLSFDLKDEVIREITLPSGLVLEKYLDDYTEIREIGGCLCICVYSRENENLQIWKMEDYDDVSSWRKIELGRPEVGDFVSFTSQLKPLGLVARTGDIILQKTSEVMKGGIFPDIEGNIGSQMFSYNLKTKLVTNIKEFVFEPCDVCMFVGSLISPQVISRVRRRKGHGKKKAIKRGGRRVRRFVRKIYGQR